VTRSTSSEFDLAIACCVWPPSPRRTKRIEAALALPINWNRFLQVIRRHRIFGLAYAALAENPGVPDKTQKLLAVDANNLCREALRMSAEAIRLDRAMAEAGVPVAFVKGLPLARSIHGTTGLRHAKDLDLLVPSYALPEARRLLKERGYRRIMPPERLASHLEARWLCENKDFEYLHPGLGIHLELHWRLFANRHLMPEVSPPGHWVTVEIQPGMGLRTLAPADQLLYLCLHGAVTGWFRVKWLADISTMLARDPESLRPLVTSALRKNLLRPVAQALLLCKRLFGTELPEDIERVLEKDIAVRWLVATALDLMTTGETSTDFTAIPFATTRISVARFLIKADWRYLLAEMRLALSSPDDWMEVPLSPSLTFLYPFLRLPLWIARKLRQLIRTK